MKKLNIYNKIILPGCVAVVGMLSSCSAFDDFLTVYPTDKITGEQFWEDKADLESAVSACYTQLTSTEMCQRLFVWGEVRSDNFLPRTSEDQNIVDMMNANLLPTNSWFDWSSIYKDIGNCNLVINKGPEIVAKDASFSEGDWLPIEAEMKALRALDYFYLVRAFRDVPLNTKYSDVDEGARDPVPQTSSQAILDYIISDLDAVKDNGMTNYGNDVDNKGKITKTAIYSILADAYLWRASKNTPTDSAAKYPGKAAEDYQKCIDCCDVVIADLLAQFTREHETNYYGYTNTSLTPLPLYLPFSTGRLEDIPYNKIFGDKNSLESIFEIEFSSGSSAYNPAVAKFLGGYNSGTLAPGILSPSSVFTEVADQPESSNPFSKTDLRMFETFKYSTGAISNFIKYIATSVTTGDGTNVANPNNSVTYGGYRQGLINKVSYCDANYILYRASDIILMKAEAMACLYPSGDSRLEDAFNLVKAVFDRSNPMLPTTYELQFDNYSVPSDLLALIMRERQRELYGEGKRWFDLVRFAMRNGSTTSMLSLLGAKYGSNVSAIKAKLATMNSLYNPVYKEEMKANTALIQNPAWIQNESAVKN